VFLPKKRRIYGKRFHSLSTLNVVFLDYTFLIHIAHPGKARHEGHIRTALGIPFFLVCSVSITLLLSPWGIIDMFLCTLSFHSSRQHQDLKTPISSFLPAARIYHKVVEIPDLISSSPRRRETKFLLSLDSPSR